MSRPVQSKAQNELNAKTLRALVKQPENKTCADCKRNDPRWASWNIGCFLCIRCSGIHRSMGTHISKVKSIDLDIWTPEQMESIQKWGNRRANLYWEAHLKAGHVPPEHKVESFIRSKYETRRWAKEGPPPNDPGVLDAGASPAPKPASNAALPATSPSAASSSRSARPPAPAPQPTAVDLLGGDPIPAPAATSVTSQRSSLLDDPPAVRAVGNGHPSRTATAPAPTPAASAKPTSVTSSGGGGGLFDLDWHDPPPQASSTTSPTSGTSRGKSDILSLFGNSSSTVRSPPLPSSQAGTGAFGGLDGAFGGLSMGSTAQAPKQTTRSTSISSGSGFGASASSSSTATSTTPASNPWAAPATNATSSSSSSAGVFASSDVWGGGGSNAGGAGMTSSPPNHRTASTTQGPPSADIWGDFNSSSTATPATGAGAGAGGGGLKDDPFGDIWK